MCDSSRLHRQTTFLIVFLSFLCLFSFAPIPLSLPLVLSVSHYSHSMWTFITTTTTTASASHDGYHRRKCLLFCSHLPWPLSRVGQAEPSLFAEASYFLDCCDSIKYLVSGSFLSSSPMPLALSTLVFHQKSTCLLTGNSKWLLQSRIHVSLIITLSLTVFLKQLKAV